MRALHAVLFASGLLVAIYAHAEPPPALQMRSYPATVSEVLDGDTVRVNIDLGFGMSMNRVSVRMVGVFAPESHAPGGTAATAKLKELLPIGQAIILRPTMSIVGREQMSFARYVGRIWRDDLDICEAMTAYLTPSR